MKTIKFNDHFNQTESVLTGHKTTMRRIIKLTEYDEVYLETAFDYDFRESVIIDEYAQYKVGEVIAILQSYHTVLEEMFARDHGYKNPIYDPFRSQKPNLEEEKGWNNKRFVKAEYMPHRIKITDIRIERLQDIDEDDAQKEGIWYEDPFGWTYNELLHFDTPQEAFRALVGKTSRKGTWDRNPWVFVYEFKLIQ